MTPLCSSFCAHQHAAAGEAGPGGRSQTALSGYREAPRREQLSEGGAAEAQKGPSSPRLVFGVPSHRAYLGTLQESCYLKPLLLWDVQDNQVFWATGQTFTLNGMMTPVQL